MKYVNSEFHNGTVLLDGDVYENCRFVQCQMLFTATAPVSLVGCVFIDCSWVFDGAAQLAFSFLSGLYRGTDAFGQQLVESIFENIRRGDLTAAATFTADAKLTADAVVAARP